MQLPQQTVVLLLGTTIGVLPSIITISTWHLLGISLMANRHGALSTSLIACVLFGLFNLLTVYLFTIMGLIGTQIPKVPDFRTDCIRNIEIDLEYFIHLFIFF